MDQTTELALESTPGSRLLNNARTCDGAAGEEPMRYIVIGTDPKTRREVNVLSLGAMLDTTY